MLARLDCLCLAVFISVSVSLHAQEVVSARDGPWTDPLTWTTGAVPHLGDRVRIEHPVYIASGDSIGADLVVINSLLMIDSTAVFVLHDGVESTDLVVNGTLEVYGTMIQQHGTIITRAAGSNFNIRRKSQYYYRWRSAGPMPQATWDSSSTLIIDSFNTNVSITSGSWTQKYGNVIFDCPALGNFMDLNGRLDSIMGNLVIRNTNDHILRLARGHPVDLYVGGDFRIEGPSEVWLGESSSSVNIEVASDFIFAADATASSYLTLTGTTRLIVHGNFLLDTTYKLKFASSSGGQSTVSLDGNLSLTRGVVDALGSGHGQIEFTGSHVQNFVRSSAAIIEGNFDFNISANATVDLGSSLLSNTESGALTVLGTLRVGSSAFPGPFQQGPSGNVQVAGELLFGPAAIVEFNGIEEQYIGNIPEFADVDVVLNNSSGLVLTGEFAIEDLRLVNGALIAGEHTLSLSGDLTMTPFAFLETEGTVTLTGDDDQAVAAPNMSFRDLLINGNNKTVDIQQPLSIRGLLSFLGTGAILKTNDHLRLISISVDDNDNGRIGPLINGNMLEGDVIVERWMPTGRTYRYLASPVQEATVADLKDDFPITGSFSDPSSGRGIISENPSLFFYSEADPTGWIGYPSTDSAKNNPLNPGLGYCAFIRQANAPVTWSVSGAINRGNIILPVTFSPGQDSLDGWNLVGNPYPCPIKWDDPGWTKENIASGIAVKDNNAGRFRIWDGAIGDLPEGAIATGQAFWVRTTAATPHLAISESVKHTGASAFFRKTPDPDYVRISATQSIHSDNAYLRILPIAKHEIDEHDIPKLKNDFLSLSLVTADGSEVALRADNILSCNVDLKVRITSYNKRDTIYLTAIGHGKFEYTTITFRDTRTGQKIVQNRQGKYLIAPADVGYVVLNLTSARATPGEVELAKFRCTDQPMDVKIKNWQPGFEYFMVRKDLIDARTFTTNDSVIHMQASWHEGYYHVIKAGICDSDTLLRNIFVSKPVTPAVDSAFLCETGTALLHAAGAEDNQIYEWLNSDEVVFHTGGSLVTQLLTKTRTYSVRINDLQSKCLSEMATANAIVHPIDSIGMSYDGHNLTAMVDPPVEWFHSGEKLPFEGNVFVPAEKGHYTVKKNLAGEECPAMGMFTVTELKLPDKTVYPNPSDGEVRFRNGSPGILKDVIDITGASVFYLCDLDCSEQECRLEIRSLSPGTYFLTFDDKGHLFYIRIFVY